MKNKAVNLGTSPSASEARKILHARARALAKSTKAAALKTESIEVLEFRLAQETYAVETRYISEVYPLKDLTPLPCTPSFVRGIVNVRGRIIPVIDIKKFFDLPDKGLTDLHRIILVKEHGLELGILADLALGVRLIPLDSLQPALPTLTGIRSDYLKGVTAERLIVLDLNLILTDPKIIVHEEVEN